VLDAREAGRGAQPGLARRARVRSDGAVGDAGRRCWAARTHAHRARAEDAILSTTTSRTCRRAAARFCACASRRTSSSARSARSSASRRCTSRA
jgi:hypothetical protein